MPRFLRRSPQEQILLLQTALLLGITSLALRVLSFRTVWSFASRAAKARRRATTKGAPDRIGRAVEVAGSYVPGGKNCLARALTAQILLERQGFSTHLRIGMAKPKGRLEGHAWLECQGKVIIGDIGLSHYTLLSALESDEY